MKLVGEEARKLPVLAPTSGWQPADIEDLVSCFFVEKGQAVTANLLASATDDASVGRLLRRSVRNWLIDKSRSSGIVALGRRLQKVLVAEEEFERVPPGEAGSGRWRLVGTGAAPWGGDVAGLVEAARQVPNVRVPQWSSVTRRAPVADRASIISVLRAVLHEAAGSLEVSQLSELFAARFTSVLDPVTVPLEGEEGLGPAASSPTPEEAVLEEEAEFAAAAIAAEIAGMLSPREREMVTVLDDTRRIAEVMGCGRSQAYLHAQRLREKLKQLIGDRDDDDTVALEVIRLCGGPTGPS